MSSNSGDIAKKSRDLLLAYRIKGMYKSMVSITTPASFMADCNIDSFPDFAYASNADCNDMGQKERANAVANSFFRTWSMEFMRLVAKSISFEVVIEGIPIQTNDAYPGPTLLSSFVWLTTCETKSIEPKTNLFIKLLRLRVSMFISSLFVPDPLPNELRIRFSFLALESGTSDGGIVESTRYAVGRIAGAKPFSSSFTANTGSAPATRPLDIVTAVPITDRQASRRDNSELHDSEK
mmetsp:Transcript_19943/g.43361  ORF Transcript_19943/g.43361 Transcript_19943/m.43361 type:complete len:237 (+) Transcript_19943:1626-2336(+)